MRKLVSFRRNVQVSIDCFPAQMLQRGQTTGQRFDELQGDLLPSRVDVVSIPTASVPFALRHIVMDQLEDAVKVRNRLNVFRVRLQKKRRRVTLDAEVLGSGHRLDAEGEQVTVVRAVPDQEGAGGLGCQHGVGLLSIDGAPVEATLLEFVERGKDHLVLRFRAKSLVTVRQPHVGVQVAAAHGGVKLAVSYHGAVPHSRQDGELWAPHRQIKQRWGQPEVKTAVWVCTGVRVCLEIKHLECFPGPCTKSKYCGVVE